MDLRWCSRNAVRSQACSIRSSLQLILNTSSFLRYASIQCIHHSLGSLRARLHCVGRTALHSKQIPSQAAWSSWLISYTQKAQLKEPHLFKLFTANPCCLPMRRPSYLCVLALAAVLLAASPSEGEQDNNAGTNAACVNSCSAQHVRLSYCQPVQIDGLVHRAFLYTEFLTTHGRQSAQVKAPDLLLCSCAGTDRLARRRDSTSPSGCQLSQRPIFT